MLTHLKKELGPTARASLIWGAFVSKLPYMAGVQVPKRADEIMATAQARLNEAMFGGRPGEVNGAFYFVSAETSHQRREDGGLAHVHPRPRAIWPRVARRRRNGSTSVSDQTQSAQIARGQQASGRTYQAEHLHDRGHDLELHVQTRSVERTAPAEHRLDHDHEPEGGRQTLVLLHHRHPSWQSQPCKG